MPGPSVGWQIQNFFGSLWQKITDEFEPAPVGQVVQPCGKPLGHIAVRATRPAFQKDQSGHILGEPVGKPYLTSHGAFLDPKTGKPRKWFLVQEYDLRLLDGRKVRAFKSMGRWDGVSPSDAPKTVPDSSMDTDCHGLTFTNGEFWISDPEVDKILAHGGYKETTHPQSGDILVYRDENGSVVHSVTVTQVDASGNVTEVSGLGGIEPAEHTNTPDTGWWDPNARTDYYTR